MTSVALATAALLAAVPAPTLHSGERAWFVPGRLPVGAHVVCKAGGHAMRLTVPAPTSARNVGSGFFTGGGIGASIASRPNGAVEVDCNVSQAPPNRLTVPYAVGRNGLGLIHGPNTLARVRKLYGFGTAHGNDGMCRVRWPAQGLVGTFASCASSSVLIRATVADARWSSLNGVHIGDSLARMLWQDQGAVRLTADAWVLGGVGRSNSPRLLAYVSRLGIVTALVVSER
jgi:hypothetical protein